MKMWIIYWSLESSCGDFALGSRYMFYILGLFYVPWTTSVLVCQDLCYKMYRTGEVRCKKLRHKQFKVEKQEHRGSSKSSF